MSARARLKHLTERDHMLAETIVWTKDGFVSRAAYDDFLKRLQRLHAELGMQAAVVIGQGADVERRLLDCLARDLHEPVMPEGERVAPQMTRSFAMGVGYALVGSAMGAAVILKSRRMVADWPRSYLEAQAGRARAGAVRRFFDRLDAEPPEIEQASAGAKQVFAGMICGAVAAGAAALTMWKADTECPPD